MRILLFGLIAEKAGTDELSSDAVTTHTLRCDLEQRIEGLSAMAYALAVDRRIVHEDRPLTGREEIAVLPPFAGG